MQAGFPLKLGSQGQLVTDLSARAVKRYSKIALEIDGVTPLKADGYFGRGEQRFAESFQANTHRPVTGQITEAEFNFIVKGISFPTTKIPLIPGAWCYTFPGSGADFNVGPSFEVGEWVQEHIGVRHQPVKFMKGGYLGLLGGDSSASYVDVTYDQYKSLEWLLDNNPEVQEAMRLINSGMSVTEAIRATKLALFFSGYSQSADGLEDALEILFGDGGFVIPKTDAAAEPGKYRALRSAIRRIIQFGNPSRQPGAMSGQIGWNPSGWGISRKIRPEWMRKVTVSITNPGDFYACVPDSDDIRPPFYGEIIHSSTKLPYFVHILNLAIPVIMSAMPFFGAFLGPLSPLVTMALGLFTGMGNMSLLGGLVGQSQQSGQHTETDRKLLALLTPMGVLTHVDDLIGLIAALPGLQEHGLYHEIRAELGNRSGIMVGCDEFRLIYNK